MRALVLSSGGLKACWQVGVLEALVESGEKYDVVCGCSAGSINAAIFCQFDVGQERQAVQTLKDVWYSYSRYRGPPL